MRRLFNIIRREPVMLPVTATVKRAGETMRKHKVGAILVTARDGHLVGIFTARDAVYRVLAEGRDAAQTALNEVMTPNPRTVAPGEVASDALRIMGDCGCRHLPILEGDKVVGIVSRIDFLGMEQQRVEGADKAQH